MAETLFSHPWAMIAGALLVSSPIIIHLINRMRFRRVQWAAMEFLLKAQKRMRRKMIIEQLILLLLRILLVLLAGLLLGRYLGFAGSDAQTRPTKHVVLLDDSPSMSDFWRGEDGQLTDAFVVARKQLSEQIVPAAGQATTPQMLEVVRLSALDDSKDFERINSETAGKINSYFASIQVAKKHSSLAEGLRSAKARFDRESQTDVTRVLHVMSDFRAVDWSRDGEAIKQAIQELNAGQVRVHLIDTAHPFRRADKKSPLYHENVGIVELKPRARVVAANEPVEFSVKVRNFGNTELRDVMCKFLLNGVENIITSRRFELLSANEEKEQTFTVEFNQTGTDQNPLNRFSLVTARLEVSEPGGLAVDNVRHAVVEVRDRLGILVVEGTDPSLRDKKEADGFYLKRVFLGSVGGLNWVNGTVRDLETKDLREFSSVYLLNVPDLSEAAVKNLEGYVREGGGLGIFLGAKVKPEAYNKLLYKDGEGLMPVPLPSKPTDAKERDLLRTFSQKILRRDPSSRDHPIVRGLYRDSLGNLVDPQQVEKFFLVIDIKQYWPVQRLGRWREDPAVKEIYCLPSEMPMGNAQSIVEPMIRKLREQIKEPKYQPYRSYLDQRPEGAPAAAKPLLDQISSLMVTSEPVGLLARSLDQLLADQGATGDPSVPILREFWALPEMSDLRNEFVRVRDSVKFGDPLYMAKQFGTGRVSLMLTTAGEAWNDWASGWGKASFAPVMGELQKYLAGGGSEDNLSLGDTLRLTFDPTRYGPNVERTRITFDPLKDKEKKPTVVFEKLGAQTMEADKGRLLLTYSGATEPGAYVFELNRLRDPAAPPNAPGAQSDYVAYAFNVDANHEGDLRRANSDDIAQMSEKSPLHSPDDLNWTDALQQKPSDLSSGRWLYLMLILILVVEQLMAVRLSHHSHPGELEEFAPTAAAALEHGVTTAEVKH